MELRWVHTCGHGPCCMVVIESPRTQLMPVAWWFAGQGGPWSCAARGVTPDVWSLNGGQFYETGRSEWPVTLSDQPTIWHYSLPYMPVLMHRTAGACPRCCPNQPCRHTWLHAFLTAICKSRILQGTVYFKVLLTDKCAFCLQAHARLLEGALCISGEVIEEGATWKGAPAYPLPREIHE